VLLFGEFATLNDVAQAKRPLRKKIRQRNERTGRFDAVEILV
jgi:hypothetical protein